MTADSELAIGLLIKSVETWLILCKIPPKKPRLCLPAFVAHILLEDMCGDVRNLTRLKGQCTFTGAYSLTNVAPLGYITDTQNPISN